MNFLINAKECIYKELNIPNIEHKIKVKRIIYLERLQNKKQYTS